MSISVVTPQPQELLRQIFKAISEKKLETWGYNERGEFFHSPPQWKDQGLLRDSRRRLDSVSRGTNTMTPELDAVLHGRFIEMLMKHFSEMFTHAYVTTT